MISKHRIMRCSLCLKVNLSALLLSLVALAQSNHLIALGSDPAMPTKGRMDAPITVLVFADFESFTSARAATLVDGVLATSADVRIVFKHAPTSSNQHSLQAHEAAVAAAAQGKFWEMHDLLFQNQTKLTREDLLGYAQSLGLDASAFKRGVDEHLNRAIVERDMVEAAALGVTTTPTFFINGRRLQGTQASSVLAGVIQSVRDGIPKGERASSKQSEASGPIPVINLDRSPTKGAKSPALRIIEFSDFECTYCAQVLPIVQNVIALYPGQIQLVFKHFPLPSHQGATLTHQAAVAAGEQGKFWQMHDLLFGHPGHSREDLLKFARLLNLDIGKFTTAMDGHSAKLEVEKDYLDGDRLGVDGVPFFIVGARVISGVPKPGQLRELVDKALKGR